jgi:hypothetical protein
MAMPTRRSCTATACRRGVVVLGKAVGTVLAAALIPVGAAPAASAQVVGSAQVDSLAGGGTSSTPGATRPLGLAFPIRGNHAHATSPGGSDGDGGSGGAGGKGGSGGKGGNGGAGGKGGAAGPGGQPGEGGKGGAGGAPGAPGGVPGLPGAHGQPGSVG